MRVAVLIGGLGRRMGMEKAEVKLCGKSLIEIAVEKYKKYDVVFVCRDENQAFRYSRFGIKCIVDFYKNFGAIAGIHAALKASGSCVVVAIDMPFVNTKLLEHIFKEGVRRGCDALMPKHKHFEPLLAFYSEKIVDKLEKAIISGERKILNTIDSMNVEFLLEEELKKFDEKLLSFFNLNTPEDLKRAEEICSQIVMEEL